MVDAPNATGSDEVLATRVSALLESGLSRDEVLGRLEDDGVDPEVAEAIIEAVTQSLRTAAKGESKRQVSMGVLLVIAGIGVTVITHALTPPGGYYIFAYGLILYGIFLFGKGIARSGSG